MNSWTIDKKNEKKYIKVELSKLHLTKQCWKSLKNFEKHIYSQYKLNVKTSYALFLALTENLKTTFDEFYVNMWLKDFLGDKDGWAYGV